MPIRHPKQTAWHVGPSHWVIARVTRHGMWDVIEVTERGQRIHHREWKRHNAEALAEAYAASRTHNTTETSS